ncbi:MAG: hypothetical protein V4603_11220 [Pseudomonadota bacterium]
MESRFGRSRYFPVGRLQSGVFFALVLLACSAGLWFASTPVQAAEISESEFNQLLESARQRGYVGVHIGILRTSLADLRDPAAIKAKMQPEIQALAVELAGNFLVGSYWESSVGTIGLHVNVQGLHSLRASQHAIQFFLDHHQYKTRSKYTDYSGGLQAVEDKLLTTSHVDVELVFNVTAEYDLDGVTGEPVVKPSAQLYEQLAQVQQALARKAFAADITNAVLLNDRAMMRATVNRNAFLGLVLSEEIRSIRPAGYVDARTTEWSPTVLTEAQKQGEVTVSLELRNGPYFAAGAGTSEASRQAMAEANRRAFFAIFSAAGLSLEKLQQDGFVRADAMHSGVLHVMLSVEALNKLYAVKDPRVLRMALPPIGSSNSPQRLPDLVSSTAISPSAEFCFAQTSMRGRAENFILDHHVLVEAADLGKAGEIFVVARFKDRPDLYWLSNGSGWIAYQRGQGRPVPYARFPQLPPLVSVMAFREPANIAASIEQGSIWVGYGLRQASGAASDSFEEMLRSDRLKVVWEGRPAAPADSQQIRYGIPTLCLDITGITKSTPRYQQQGIEEALVE